MDDRLKIALQALAKNPDFRLLLTEIYQLSNMAGSPFTANALTTAHNCGKLEMGQQVFALLNDAAPHFYPALMKGILDDLTNGRDDDTGSADD